MYDQVLIIVRRKDIPEATRAYLIGRILKEAYAQNPATFPLPLGETGDNETLPESIKRASLHLMFSKNPFDEKEPFERVISELKELSLPQNITSDSQYQHSFRRKLKKLGKSFKKRYNHIEHKVKDVAMKNVDLFIEKYGIMVSA